MLFLVNSHFQAFLGLDEAGRPAKEKSRTEAVEKKNISIGSGEHTWVRDIKSRVGIRSSSSDTPCFSRSLNILVAVHHWTPRLHTKVINYSYSNFFAH